MKERDEMISLSIFSGLYNQKKNVYSVVVELIIVVLRSNRLLRIVTPEDLVDEIKHKFGFLLPITVIDRACKNIIKSDNPFLTHRSSETKTFVIDNIKLSKTSDISNEIQSTTNLYNSLFDNLKKYVLEKGNYENIDDNKLLSELYDYLINGSYSSGTYNLQINSFIIERNQNPADKSLINDLSQGAAIYNGLQFTTENDDFSTNWRNKFTIFLSTEIIFDFLGLNGDLYQRYASDLVSLVNDMNSGKYKYIEILYTEKTRSEIEAFFEAAKGILSRHDYKDIRSPAMQKIIDQCEHPSDLVLLKSKYILSLDKCHIKQHKYQGNPCDELSHQYNLDSASLRDMLNPEEIDDNEIDNTIHDFNEINYLRKGELFQNLEHSIAILLTRNFTKVKINRLILQKGVPFCTTYDILINRIWFKTSTFKTFPHRPITLDILARSKLTLFNVLNTQVTSVSNDISKILASNDTDYDKEAVKMALVEMKSLELDENFEINETNIDGVMNSIRLTSNKIEEIVSNMKIKDVKQKEQTSLLKNSFAELLQNNINVCNQKAKDTIELIVNEKSNFKESHKKLSENITRCLNHEKIINSSLITLAIMIVSAIISFILFIYFLQSHEKVWLFLQQYFRIPQISQNIFDNAYYTISYAVSYTFIFLLLNSLRKFSTLAFKKKTKKTQQERKDLRTQYKTKSNTLRNNLDTNDIELSNFTHQLQNLPKI